MFPLSAIRPMKNLAPCTQHITRILMLHSPFHSLLVDHPQVKSRVLPYFFPEGCSFLKQPHCLLVNLRQQSSVSYVEKKGLFQRVKLKLRGILSDKSKLNACGPLAYEKIADDIDYAQFLKYFQLPDTFQSWFLAIQLHVWMGMLVTVNQRNGRMFRNLLVDAMWNDVEFRLDKLAEMKSSKKKKYLEELTSQFQCAIISYDEGILCDDKTLAASAWRTLFTFQLVDPQLLEDIVAYIRIQLLYIDGQHPAKIMYEGKIEFKSLEDILPGAKK